MAEHDHGPDCDHDHDHDHDDGEYEEDFGDRDPAEVAAGRVDRLRRSVLACEGGVLHAALQAMGQGTLQQVAVAASAPAVVLRRSKNPGQMLKRVKDVRQLALVAEEISDAALTATIEALGDHSEDPTPEQLTQALDDVRSRFTAAELAVMLAYVAATGQRAAAHCDQILETDDRYDLTAPPAS